MFTTLLCLPCSWDHLIAEEIKSGLLTFLFTVAMLIAVAVLHIKL